MGQRSTYLKNLVWLEELRNDALKNKRALELYLLTYFRVELGLILLIDYRMTTSGQLKFSDKFYKRITEGRLRFSELINIFCVIFGDDLFQALDIIRRERNNFIHSFFKKFQKKIDFEKYVEDLLVSVILVDEELGKVIHEELDST